MEVATQFQECIAGRGFQRRGRGRGNGARVEKCERFSSNRSKGAWKFVLDVLGAKLLVNHVISKVFVDDNSGLTLAGGNRSLNLLFVLPRSKHRDRTEHTACVPRLATDRSWSCCPLLATKITALFEKSWAVVVPQPRDVPDMA